MCAYAWLAGKVRHAGLNAHIGFHGIYDAGTLPDGHMDGNSPATASGPGNAIIGAYLRQLGFNYDTIGKLSSPSPKEMLWLTQKNAAELGITYTFDDVPVAENKPTIPPKSNVITDWSKYGGWIQVFTRENYREAKNEVSSLKRDGSALSDYIAIFSSGDKYVVAVGPIKGDVNHMRDVWVRNNVLPKDSFVTKGEHWNHLVDGGAKINQSTS
jgi:hypothetical protein